MLLISLHQIVHTKGTGGASLQPQRMHLRMGINTTILTVILTGQLNSQVITVVAQGSFLVCGSPRRGLSCPLQARNRGAALFGGCIPLQGAGSVMEADFQASELFG